MKSSCAWPWNSAAWGPAAGSRSAASCSVPTAASPRAATTAALPGMPHCTPESCGPGQRCLHTSHAEENALGFCDGPVATAYVTDEPCLVCTRAMVRRGIRRVVFLRPYASIADPGARRAGGDPGPFRHPVGAPAACLKCCPPEHDFCLDWFEKRTAMKRERNDRGFSLVELLLVLAILGIISAIAIPSFLGQRRRARVIGDAQANAQVLRMKLESYRAETGVYGTASATYTWTASGTVPTDAARGRPQLHGDRQQQDGLCRGDRSHGPSLHADRDRSGTRQCAGVPDRPERRGALRHALGPGFHQSSWLLTAGADAPAVSCVRGSDRGVGVAPPRELEGNEAGWGKDLATRCDRKVGPRDFGPGTPSRSGWCRRKPRNGAWGSGWEDPWEGWTPKPR